MTPQWQSIIISHYYFSPNPILQSRYHSCHWFVFYERRQESHADLGVCVEHCPVRVSRLAACHPGMMPFIMRKLEIIMEINFWTAVACELYHAELLIWRAMLQCRAEQKHLTFAASEGRSWTVLIHPHRLIEQECGWMCMCACVGVLWFNECLWVSLLPDAYRCSIN